MIKKLIAASNTVLLMVFFTQASAQKTKLTNPVPVKKEVKFIDDIEVTLDAPAEKSEVVNSPSKFADFKPLITSPKQNLFSAASSINIEQANNLQLKYSVLLDIEVENVQNIGLFQAIDQWYGTPYVYGGSSKSGVDCSAFVQAIFADRYALSLPRTAREQSKLARPISRTELKEGDLVFFNTQGGVSHVGIYLQNNKFVHAASSEGVMISDLYDDYWMKRFISAGRIDTTNPVVLVSQP